MLIWEVVYDCVFSSSSGMERYSVEHNNQSGLVWTSGNSLGDVQSAIQDGLDNQTELTRLISSKYIGATINPPNNVRSGQVGTMEILGTGE